MLTKDIIRRCIFRPYRKGCGPTFSLTVWDTNRRGHDGKSVLGYQLRMGKVVLFEGEDFRCPIYDCVDSDENIAALMSFLTLRPGDTDREYFENYTPEQMDYCSSHAEALACEVMNRFPE